MSLEVLLLCSLIFVFIVSFCGLLQKIKQSYDRERIIAVLHCVLKIFHVQLVWNMENHYYNLPGNQPITPTFTPPTPGRYSSRATPVAAGAVLIGILSISIRICVKIRACQKAKRTRRQLTAIIVENGNTIREERIARQHTGLSDAHVNTTFVEDFDSIHFDRDVGIFPGAPPRYGPLEPPPKYEDIFKAEANITRHQPTAPPQTIRTHTNIRTTQASPPYTISS